MPPRDHRRLRWTAAVLVVSAPYLVLLALTLWRTPFPITEAIAIFQDAVRQWPLTTFPLPEQSYYRPLFYVTIGAIWHGTESLPQALAGIRLVQIVPVCVLVVLFVVHLAPRTPLDAAAAAVATAVLIGSPGFADNLELPLSYTTVGMPIGLAVWALLNRHPRLWHGAAVMALTLIAIGFKEQGLVVVAIAIVAWFTSARGASRGVVLTVVAIGVAYLAIRLRWRGSWALFEQAVGFGFREIEPSEAVQRFGDFPYWIYVYSGASTIANVLFAEPTRGVFHIVAAMKTGQPQAWQMLQLLSSVALTMLIAWWGIAAVRNRGREWSQEARACLVLIVVLLACGALSFNYSRARLGGMAVPFYAMAAYFAIRAFAARIAQARPWRLAVAAAALTLLAAAWHTRAVATLEYARATSARNHREWLLLLPARRLEFAEQPVYLRIMNDMIEQGTRPGAPRPTRYPDWVPFVQPLP